MGSPRRRARAAGKSWRTPRLNSGRARARAGELQERLRRRQLELEQERQLSSLPPVTIGGAIVIPQGLLDRMDGLVTPDEQLAHEVQRIERLAMEAVLDAERCQGFDPRDVSAEKAGYDLLSYDRATGQYRFIEVKGRVAGATYVTVTKNEILTGLNKQDDYWLAVVFVDGDQGRTTSLSSVPFSPQRDRLCSHLAESVDQGAVWTTVKRREARPIRQTETNCRNDVASIYCTDATHLRSAGFAMKRRSARRRVA